MRQTLIPINNDSNMTKNINSLSATHIHSAQVVIFCADLADSLDFFTKRLGFRVDMIVPADSPSTAVISGHGVTLRLEEKAEGAAVNHSVVLRLLCDMSLLPAEIPNELLDIEGVRIELVDSQTPVDLPIGTHEFVLSRLEDKSTWSVGRAGMHYRDLIPSRLGGRFIASHICIPDGGEVPDYVHFHKIRFQMIYCKAGWVRLVYEDQGEPFVLNAGDCILQPPQIRHRVLEASPGLEVIEISCPAKHETHADHNLLLPTAQVLTERLFDNQRFVRHIASEAKWIRSPMDGFEIRDTNISKATDGLAEVRVVRSTSEAKFCNTHTGEFLFLFVLNGELELSSRETGNHQLKAGDSSVIPSGVEYNLQTSAGFEMLEVYIPQSH